MTPKQKCERFVELIKYVANAKKYGLTEEQIELGIQVVLKVFLIRNTAGPSCIEIDGNLWYPDLGNSDLGKEAISLRQTAIAPVSYEEWIYLSERAMKGEKLTNAEQVQMELLARHSVCGRIVVRSAGDDGTKSTKSTKCAYYIIDLLNGQCTTYLPLDFTTPDSSDLTDNPISPHIELLVGSTPIGFMGTYQSN